MRAYTVSAWFLFVMVALSTLVGVSSGTQPLGYLIVAIVLAMAVIGPLIPKGRFVSRQRYALIISGILMLLFSSALVAMMLRFSRDLGEGPNGEGSPAAYLFMTFFVGVCYTCPWLLTFIRGVQNVRSNKSGEQVMHVNRP
jgi:hypothetical protein